ncbi:MAG: transporter substrate-binding protein [Bradyrhizobium sp.]|nr:transporter substrate-binding protein [Bradyrhizobium sp.]
MRRARRRRNWSLPILAAGLLLFGAAVGVWHFAFKPVVLRVAVGPAGSEDHKLIQALGQAFAQDGSSVKIVLVPTEGSVESIAALEGSKADLAVARGDLNLPRDATSVAILRKNMVVLWSPSGIAAKGSKKEPAAKVKGIDGLAGKRVGVIGRTPANVTLLRVILTESGVDPDKVTVVQFGVGQIADLTRDMSLDAFMTVGPLDSKITTDAIAATARARGEPKFLPIDVSEAIAQKHPIYDAEEIPGSTFSASPARPDDKIDTISVNHLLIARKALSESAVGAFTRQLFAVRPSLARDLPSAAKIEKPDTDKDAALPAHPGAAAYIDGTERTFLEKYSDFLWGGILLLSGIGSGGAWLRHYLKHNERDKNARQRDRLLLTIAEVRQADTVDDLARMQGEVDQILRETLDAYDDGAIEAADLSAVGLVLEQFRHAVSDRRAALAAMPVKQQIRVM